MTLADGTPAAVISYSGTELGESVAGQATLIRAPTPWW